MVQGIMAAVIMVANHNRFKAFKLYTIVAQVDLILWNLPFQYHKLVQELHKAMPEKLVIVSINS